MKVISEMVKFSFHHRADRALYCFLIMTLWIFLIIAGMYKYILMEEGTNFPRQAALRRDVSASKGDVTFKMLVNKYCNPAEDIQLGAEGLSDDSWALQGVMVIVRHGDRGPLTHVRGVETADCGVSGPSPLLQRYQEYINNMTALGKAPWSQSPGPFHNLPLLPTSPLTECRLGQLTPRGLLQLLTIGDLLGRIYTPRLGWDFYGNKTDSETSVVSTKNPGNSKAKYIEMVRNAQNVQLNKFESVEGNAPHSDKPLEGDIVVHSTRYRRAFQSALAFMWSVLGAIGPSALSTSVAKESHSLTFCAEDCACPAAEYYARKVSQESKKRLESHKNVVELIEKLSNIVFQSPSQVAKDAHILEDALLTYICHSAPLPCVQKPVQDSQKSDNKKILPKKETLHAIKNLKKGFRTLLESEGEGAGAKWMKRKLRFMEAQKKKSILDFDSQMEKEKLGYYQQKMLENADINYEDVILIKRNMDGDFNFNGDNVHGNNADVDDGDSDQYDGKDDKVPENKAEDAQLVCVKKDELASLFSYTDWEMNLVTKSNNFNKASLLRAYGMLHQVVKYILKMVSKGQPKLVLFSGHDKTLQYLSLALGLSGDNILNMHYASRLTIEIYKNEDKDYVRNRKSNANHKAKVIAPLDFFLRVIFNGKDVTRQVSFCRGSTSILADNLMRRHNPSAKQERKAYLCRIENIIRFAHEDYFSIFNATNFKDSCVLHH